MMSNILIVSDCGSVNMYDLDMQEAWSVGRKTSTQTSDISLSLPIISRQHGSFQNIDGIWFYYDKKSENGTIYNGKMIKSGLRDRIKPVQLNYGDKLIFGGDEGEEISNQNAWAMFLNS